MDTIRKIVGGLILAALALIPLGVALAKGPPDKVTITGPGIDKPIEIVDSNLLNAFSFYQFNDLTRRIAEPDVEPGEGYHITRYVKDSLDENKLITWDRLTFYFDPAGGPGYVFFDGLDPSIGSTEGQGEWYLASEQGGAAMRQILAEAAPTPNATQQAVQISPVAWAAVGGSLVLVMAAVFVVVRTRRAAKTAATH
jgi:hypothetical protein